MKSQTLYIQKHHLLSVPFSAILHVLLPMLFSFCWSCSTVLVDGLAMEYSQADADGDCEGNAYFPNVLSLVRKKPSHYCTISLSGFRMSFTEKVKLINSVGGIVHLPLVVHSHRLGARAQEKKKSPSPLASAQQERNFSLPSPVQCLLEPGWMFIHAHLLFHSPTKCSQPLDWLEMHNQILRGRLGFIPTYWKSRVLFLYINVEVWPWWKSVPLLFFLLFSLFFILPHLFGCCATSNVVNDCKIKKREKQCCCV